MFQTIYASTPFGYDQSTLNGILVNARRKNANDGITGALICRRDIYLQLLEGPERAINDTLARIRKDDRHVNVNVLVYEAVPHRMFEDWAMLHDPAKSWIWSPEDVSNGVHEQLPAWDVRAVFDQLAKAVA